MINGLAHIGVFIKDIDASKKFYEDILGFEKIWECVIDGDGGDVKIAFEKKGDLVLEFVQLPGEPDRPADGIVAHIAMAVKDIEKVRADLEGRGIVFLEDEIVFNAAVFPNGAKWTNFKGPDGEVLELNEIL